MKTDLSAKFSQNLHCFKALEATHDTVLFEASHHNTFWGAGLGVLMTHTLRM